MNLADIFAWDIDFILDIRKGDSFQALVEKPETGDVPRKWREGGYLEKGRVPRDPWDNEYIYLSPGLKGDFDIISYGADGAPGGEGEDKDINNWDTE